MYCSCNSRLPRAASASPSQFSLWKTSRSFSHSAFLLKKGGKQKNCEDENETNEDKIEPVVDPFDFSELESGVERAQSRLKDDLSKLRAGGRFNPESVENLRVHAIKGSKDTERLANLAQVIPRGRTLNILVGEEAVCYGPNTSCIYEDIKVDLFSSLAHQAHLLCHPKCQSQPHATTRCSESLAAQRQPASPDHRISTDDRASR